MSASILQEIQVSGSASASSRSAAFSSSVTVGSTIHSIGEQTVANTVTYTFSDNNGGAYTQLDSYWEPNNGSGVAHAYAPNHAAGATTCTVSFSSASAYSGGWFREIGGVAASPLDAHATFTSHAVTTLSTTITNTAQPAIISAVCYVSGGGFASGPTATSGTQDAQGWNYGGSVSGAVSSHQRITTTGSNTVSFGIASAGGLDLVAVAAIFDEPPPPPPPPTFDVLGRRMQVFVNEDLILV